MTAPARQSGGFDLEPARAELASLMAAAGWVMEPGGRAFGEPPPRLAIIAGSGLGGLAARVRSEISVSFGDLRGFAPAEGAGVQGHLLRWLVGSFGRTPIHFLSGRRHLYEGEGIEPVTAGVRLLARLGVRRLLLLNAAGGVSAGWNPGDLMLIRDHLAWNHGVWPPGTGAAGAGPKVDGGDFMDGRDGRERGRMHHPGVARALSFQAEGGVYCPRLAAVLRESARKASIPLREGVYGAMAGPTFETPAEAAMLRHLGADAAGMSTAPEAYAARCEGMRVAAISVVTNVHRRVPEGEVRPSLTHEEVLETGARAGDRLGRLLAAAVPLLALEPEDLAAHIEEG